MSVSTLLDSIASYSSDIEVDYQQDTYVEPKQPGFKLLPPGNYRVIINDADVVNRTAKGSTAPSLEDGWPKLVVEKFTIVAPEHVAGKTIIAYADVRTKPRTYDGELKSDLIDWVRAYDATASGLTSRDGQLAALAGFLQDGRELTIRIAWDIYDKAFIDGIKAQGNTPTNDEYKQMRATKLDEFGKGIGPSGNEVKAQYKIAAFYSSLTADTVRLARP
jgi:hypothetical protein